MEPTTQQDAAPYRVLLVDDEIAEMEMSFIRNLRERGWDVEAVASVAEAKARLTALPPFDVVITDMVMPEGDEAGLKVIEAAHGADPTTRIVVLTARGTPATAFASGRRGVRAYVDKLDPQNGPEDELGRLVPVLAEEARRVRALRERLASGGLDPDSIDASLDMANEARERLRDALDSLAQAANRQRIEAVIGAGHEAQDACEELLEYLSYLVREGLEL